MEEIAIITHDRRAALHEVRQHADTINWTKLTGTFMNGTKFMIIELNDKHDTQMIRGLRFNSFKICGNPNRSLLSFIKQHCNVEDTRPWNEL